MRLLLSLVFGGVLAWQAMASAVGLYDRITSDSAVGYGQRLLADTATRIRTVIGEDMAIYRALRQHLPAAATVLTRVLEGPMADLHRLAAEGRRIHRLSQLLFPNPLLLSVPEPIDVMEGRAPAGSELWLLVLAGDPEPAGRAGWSCIVRSERFRLWQFQKG